MSDRVLVALDRKEAAHVWERSVHGGLLVEEETSDAFRAALDTDREETIARIAERLMWEDGIDDTGQIYGPEADLTPANHDLRGEYESKARAVLSVLEGADDE